MFNNEKGLKLVKDGNLIVQSKHQLNGFLIGSILGDTHLHKYILKKQVNLSERKRSRVRMTLCHCEKQYEYLLWKIGVLRAYIKFGNIVIDKSKDCRVYYKSTSLVKSSKKLIYLYERFYKLNKKSLDKRLLNRLTALGLAIWFMDDGSLIPHSYNKNGSIRALKLRLHTNSFDLHDHKIMQEYFLTKNINFNITKDKKYYCLSTGREESIINFMTLILPFVDLINCMSYKTKAYKNFISANHPKNLG
jgi:hypothetical protein